MDLQHNSAFGDGVPVSARRDDDRVIETSIPSRLDSSALERLPHPRRAGARHHLDSRRSGGHAGRRAVGRAEGKSDAAFFQFRRRIRQQRLSRRRRARRARLRLAHRPDRAQETVLHHAGALSHRHRGDGAVLECRELCAVPVSHRRRHRRRIHRDQFDDPGTGAGALSRMDRSRHQRQLLDRRGDGRRQRDCSARSRS